MNNHLSLRAASTRSLIEPLEQRIAPAVLLGSQFTTGTGEITLEAGTNHAGLSTAVSGDPFGAGAYLLFVQKGSCKVFTTDLNHNGQLDPNEITGIAAGPNLRLIAFTDIHGDIVTNLNSDNTLTDSDNNASNGRDGRVVLPNKIEAITLRSLTAADLPTPDANHPNPLGDRLALTSYSIFGNIYAGGGFGVAGGGLTVDTTGTDLLAAKFNGATGVAKYIPTTPEIGSIKVGTAVSGQYFNFRTTGANTVVDGNNPNPNLLDIRGQIVPFVAKSGADGADIIGVQAASDTMAFNLGTLQAGDGGFNGRGGNVINVAITGDTAGGYSLIAGNAGVGLIGKAGGSILNYSDQGSVTGQVILKSGNGGKGLTGAGGAPGVINFDPAKPQNVSGNVRITLGNGGDGFLNGGNGGSLPSAQITVPEGDIPVPVSAVSTWHAPGTIGSTQAFDFNGTEDNATGHFSDAVYTTNKPGDLVVVFGDGSGFDPHQTIHLNGPANAQIVVADFNGDGHVDIAAASGNASNAGISVFLSQYDTLGRFTGFSDALHTALPRLDAKYFQSAFTIDKLAAGDFNGDGATDLAFISTQNVIGSLQPDHVLTVLLGTHDSTHGSGFFFADYSNPAAHPFTVLTLPSTVSGAFPILKATALKAGDTQEAVLAGFEDDTKFFVATYTAHNLTTTTQSLGSVDTNRTLNTKQPPDNQSLEEVKLRDFTILDLNGDGNADVVALAKQPEGFLQTFKGDGMGAFPIASTGAAPATSPDNSGIKISGKVTDGGLDLSQTNFVGILAVNADGDPSGAVNDIALVDYRTDKSGIMIHEIVLPDFTSATLNASVPVASPAAAGDETIRAFDVYTPQPAADPATVGYFVGLPYADKPLVHDFVVAGDAPLGDVQNLVDNGFFISAGHGGNSLLGAGGAGGSIGQGILANKTTADGTRLTGGFDVLLPANKAYAGTLRFVAGAGGQGYLAGGAGGSLSGISVGYSPNVTLLTSTVSLFSGNGGDSLMSAAGTGGSISRVHIETGSLFVAGRGGHGVFGGAGGNVVGNHVANATDATVSDGTASAPDTDAIQATSEDSFLVVQGGAAGSGLRAGGAGGSIIGFSPQFLRIAGGEGGLLHYTAGDGGDAVAGAGGRGGFIFNSSPLDNSNNLVGDIFLKSGRGGNGIIGGNGGVILSFHNSPSSQSTPLNLSVLAGSGGNGSLGRGGAGGTINGIQATSTGRGTLYDFDFSDPLNVIDITDAVVGLTPVTYNRIIAGAGGNSGGALGGVGGSVLHVQSGASSGGFVTAAGKGGNALLTGGAGGNLTDVHLTADPASGKVLFVAGDGGDTFASTPPNPATGQQFIHAFGGVRAFGGAGGSMNNVSQDGSSGVNVDLIAGNGGSTVNFGTAADLAPHVGRGGSVVGVRIAGNIGNSDPSVAIKSYNSLAAGETMSDFIKVNFLGSPLATLDDTLGNVGLVAGAAGRVRDNDGVNGLDPTSFALNGVVANVSASNIMSAVAGSVERIASIQAISNIVVTTTGGTFGANKADQSMKDYFKPDGTLTHDRAYIGGALIDGAIVAKNTRPLQSDRDFILQ